MIITFLCVQGFFSCFEGEIDIHLLLLYPQVIIQVSLEQSLTGETQFHSYSLFSLLLLPITPEADMLTKAPQCRNSLWAVCACCLRF